MQFWLTKICRCRNCRATETFLTFKCVRFALFVFKKRLLQTFFYSKRFAFFALIYFESPRANISCIFNSVRLLSLAIYTGQQKKGYKVIFLLFYKTVWHILFAYCKHNLCCFRVDLPNLNQVQWSETSARQFEWFCTTCTISQLSGTVEAK